MSQQAHKLTNDELRELIKALADKLSQAELLAVFNYIGQLRSGNKATA